MRTRRSSRRHHPDQLWLFPSLGQETAEEAHVRSGSTIATVVAVRRERLVSIPPSEPFLSTLARGLIDGTLTGGEVSATGPLDLSRVTLLMPTRRATRELADAFLAASPARAVLLPQIRAIFEPDEEAALLGDLASGPIRGAELSSAAALDLPAALPPLDRLLVLTSLMMRWSAALRDGGGGGATAGATGAGTPAQAISLAGELARLIDMVEAEGVSLDGVAGLVREDMSAHWQQTVEFLGIVTRWWPAHLAEHGLMSAGERRNRLIRAEAARLTTTPPADPVIVAGVAGATPAMIDLIRAVLALPQGALVLPGLDLDLDEPSWRAITDGAGHVEHPQHGLATLLARLGRTQADVALLSQPDLMHVPARSLRARLVSEALRPSATTGRWQQTLATTDRALAARAFADVQVIEAPSAQDEAEAIALILREVTETPGRTGALVTPDRTLARRVAVRLEAWGIRVDDESGRPLPTTPPGALLDIALDVVASGFAPKPVVALTKHPLVRLGLDPARIRRAARALELIAFRGPYLGHGIVGLIAALDDAERNAALGPDQRAKRLSRAVMRLFPEDWEAARDLVARLAQAFAPLIALFDTAGTHPLAALAAAHRTVAVALAETGDAADDAANLPLWREEAGTAARMLLDGLAQTDAAAALPLAAADYPDVLRALMRPKMVQARGRRHPRVSIWSPFETRLLQPDVMILGALNEGTWPQAADPGPWLNRPMRAALGLPAPEAKLGEAAHDVTMALGAPRVYLTRAQKIDGVPTVRSRWLMRLDALLGGLDLARDLRASRPAMATATTGAPATWLAWARERDKPGRWVPAARPMPRPPVALRPRKLSVSAIETWIANPYAIFAGHILGLEPLPALGATPDASVRGSIVHEAVARFTKAHPIVLPDDIAGAIMDHAAAVIADWTGHPRVAAFWLPRLERFARWVAETELDRRRDVREVVAEISGRMQLGSPDRPFTLTARADRLDILPAGTIAITDYKTGTPPTNRLVVTQKRPQLPLEAAIALAGGFGTVTATQVRALRYIQASGGDPAGFERAVKTTDLAALVTETVRGLERHIALFDLPTTPYAVTRRKDFHYDYDAFAQLARVAEWSATGAEGEDAEEDAA